jgi:hypothetical protein
LAEITVRDFGFHIPTTGGVTNADVALFFIEKFELDMANAMRENALAVPYRGPLLMRLVQRELALVLSLFHHAPPGQPLTRHPAYSSSSLHIRRLTTEVMALGILNAVVTDRFGHADIAHYDVLPPALSGTYPNGIRPDLRFAQAGQVLAGESRGRNGRQPIRVEYTVDQLRRLNELVNWSRHPDCDPVCMAWSWMDDKEIVTDFFSQRAIISADIEKFGVEMASPEESPIIFRDRLFEEVVPEETQAPDIDMQADFLREQKVARISSHKRLREAELIESAPNEHVPGLSGDWRGEWVQVPSVDNGPAPRVLLAASDQVRRRKVTREARNEKAHQSRNIGLEASTDGRLLFAIDWRSRPARQVGEELDRLIELDSDLE